MSTTAWTFVITVNVLSIATLGMGLLLYRKLIVHRYTFLAALQTDGKLPKPKIFGAAGWSYLTVTLLLVVCSFIPFFHSLTS